MPGLLYKVQTRWLFHSHIKLKIPVYHNDTLFDQFFDTLQTIDLLYNSYSEDSYISKINKNAGKFVEVDETTIELLSELIRLSGFFDGEFDITVMPLIRLWGFYKNNNIHLPSAEELEQTKALVNYKNIETGHQKLKIGIGQEIITGSFIKAFAVDKLVEEIKQKGITDAMINAGGSTIMALTDEKHPAWQVRVHHPDTKEKMFVLNLSNKCFSTSAQTNTFVEIDGERYGHIISPKTGYPSRNKQVGIVSDSCFLGDIVSAGLFNFEGKAFLERIKEIQKEEIVEGFMIDKNNEIFFSEGFNRFVIN